MAATGDITELLREMVRGDCTDALDRLMPLVYGELRRIAHAQLRNERPGHTLSTTALVHEAYLRLVGIRQVAWRDRAHFLAIAARLMRRVLIDYARAAGRQKRGAGVVMVPLMDALTVPSLAVDEGMAMEDVLALDEAMTRFEGVGERPCRVVECRCFAGMSVEETAVALGTSTATVKRDWAFARAWLNRELSIAGRVVAAGDGT